MTNTMSSVFLLAALVFAQCTANVLMTTTVGYDASEFFDPSNQPNRPDFSDSLFGVQRVAARDDKDPPATSADQLETTTSIGDPPLSASDYSLSNDTEAVFTAPEPAELIGEPDYLDQFSSHHPTAYQTATPEKDNLPTTPIQSPTLPTNKPAVEQPLFSAFAGFASSVEQTTANHAESAVAYATTTAAPTPQPPTRRIKKIQTTPPPPPLKQNANEILQRLLEDRYIRTPMAALIDTSSEALRKTKMLWRAALRPQVSLDLVLVGYDANGIGVTYTFKNTRSMLAGLDSIQESKADRGTAFFGINRALELIPYDSAIFVCTDNIAADEDNLGKYAALTLLKKRIRLYLIWFGPSSSVIDGNDASGNSSVDGGMLGEVALKSGGQIIRVTEDTVDGPNGGVGLITLYLRKHVLGANEVEIPVPADVPSEVSYTHDDTLDDANSTLIAATVTTPNGGSFTKFVHYMQQVRERRSQYDGQDVDDEITNEPPNEPRTGISFPDDYANSDENMTEVETIMGRNSLQAVTAIQMGVQSQLLASPGSTVQLYFEVTNLREEPTFHNFQVSDERRYLQTLSPLNIWLRAGQTTTVIVTAFVPSNAEVGTTDKITFTSQGVGLASQAATLTVTGSSALLDTRAPNIYWAYGSRCDYKTGAGQCASAVWSVEVTTQDLDTGILRVQSKPAGLTIRNAFVAGTNNEVKATYTSSCCVTRVVITAVDVAGNQKTVTLDVTEFLLNEASIAAIALGVVLILIVIILLILLCVWCARRRRESRDLEMFRARSGGSQPTASS